MANGVDSKQRVSNYLSEIRENSAYTTYRVVVDVVHWLLIIAGALFAIVGVIGFASKDASSLIFVVAGLAMVLIAKVGKQSTVMLADIADATIDASSRKKEI